MVRSSRNLRLEGVIIPMITPFKKNEDLDEEGLRKLTRRLLGQGVHGLFPNSSIGEQPKLSFEEKRKVIDIVVNEVNGKVPVIPGTGEVSTRQTLELTRYALDAGADAALIVEPYYFRPSADALFDHYKTVNDTLDIPLVLYDVPRLSGYSLPVDVIERVADLDNVVAIKDSSGDMIRFSSLLRLVGKKISVLQGIDTLFFPSLAIGSPGGMLGGGNIVARFEVTLYDAFKRGDLKTALDMHNKIADVCSAMGGYAEFPVGYKEALSLMGFDAGSARKPSVPLSEEERKELKAILQRNGLIRS